MDTWTCDQTSGQSAPHEPRRPAFLASQKPVSGGHYPSHSRTPDRSHTLTT
jgi:hypothetical protein